MRANIHLLSPREQRTYKFCMGAFVVCAIMVGLIMTALSYTGGTASQGKFEKGRYFLGYVYKANPTIYTPVSFLNFRVHQGIDCLMFLCILTTMASSGIGVYLQEKAAILTRRATAEREANSRKVRLS